MVTFPIIAQLLRGGNPLFVRCDEAIQDAVKIRALITQEKLHFVDLLDPLNWVKLELGFDLQPITAGGVAKPSKHCFPPRMLVRIVPDLSKEQVRIMEYLIQWTQNRNCLYQAQSQPYQMVLVGDTAAWGNWYTKAEFLTQARIEDLAGISLDFVSL